MTAEIDILTPETNDSLVESRAAKRRLMAHRRSEMVKALSSFFPDHSIVLEVDDNYDCGIKAITLANDGHSLTIEGEFKYGSRCSITINPA